LEVKQGSSIDDRVWVYAIDRIEIGKNCCIGEGVLLLTGSHNIHSSRFDLVTKSITISDNVWVATNAIILPGVTIGEGAVVAAGSVVTKDVEPWTVVGGNPARVIGKREIQ
jgi:acetyltransferase-like isoleucine patch superfamily enzyme